MNQSLNIHFEVTKNDRTYVLSIPMNSPLGECYDACHEMLQEIMKQAQASADKAKASKEQDPVAID
jgi:hypothetical protein